MLTIKAFDKNLRCRGFQYKIGETYEMPKKDVKICSRGFHAANNFDISNTVDYYPDIKNTRYCIVDINVIGKSFDKVVGNKIKIIREIVSSDELISYDKTGKWTCEAGKVLKDFDFEKGLEHLIKKDITGEYVYRAGYYWKKFDYEKGLKHLIKVNKSCQYIYLAGIYWKRFDFQKGFNALIEKDDIGEYICKAGKYWKEFDFEKGLKALVEKDKDGKYIHDAIDYWREFDYVKCLNLLIEKEKKGERICYDIFWKVLKKVANSNFKNKE